MNIKLSLVLSLLAFSVLTGCGEGPEDSTGNGGDTNPPSVTKEPAKPTLEAIPFDADAIYLERMYATSVDANGPEYVLDGDMKTSWKAMPGAGPDEGIMLYFEEPVEISGIEISPMGITTVQCFVNGANAGFIGPSHKKEIFDPVQSLFLRVVNVNGQEKKTIQGDDWVREFTSYPDDLQVGLREIELKGSNGKLLKVRPLHLEPGSVSATSTLSPEEAYNGDYLFDSKLEFGWAEGSDELGVGEKLTFTFNKAVRIEKIKVWNGYQRSKSHFERNARAKSVSFGLKGQAGNAYALEDAQAPTTVELAAPLEGESFELGIEDFYAGKSYKDLVLSELRFFDGQQWFGIQSDGHAKRKTALQQKVSGTVLEKILDRQINDAYTSEYDDDDSKTRLILRSNGSFVLYRNRTGMANDNEKKRMVGEVADGNWSIESIGEGEAKVKIFGKMQRVMERDLWYKGKSKSDRTRIFSEILTITDKEITGQKLIELLRLTKEGSSPYPLGAIESNQYPIPDSEIIESLFTGGFLIFGDA